MIKQVAFCMFANVFHGVKQLSGELSKEIGQLVKTFPRAERCELADDLLRAARSIAANISEGWGRRFPKEKIFFYNISSGSADECDNHLIEAFNNGYIDNETKRKFHKKLHIISVKLTNLIISTRKRIHSSVPLGHVARRSRDFSRKAT